MRIITSIFIILTYGVLNAQTTTVYNLQQCIDIAVQNNINLKMSEVSADITKNNTLQSKAQALPSLNAGGNHIYQYGRTIDRYTNTFANTQVLSQNFYLTAQWTIWAGLTQYHTIQSNKMNLLSAKENVNQQKNDLIVNVATAYINVLLSEDVLTVNKTQYAITQQQYERTKILVEQGSSAISALKDIEAQLANDEVNVITAQNNYDMNLLALKQIMNINPEQDIKIVKPDISIQSDVITQYSVDDVYKIAQKTQPMVKKAEYNILANEYLLKANRGKISPTFNVSASLATGYSGLAKRVIGYQSRTDTLGTIPGYGPLVYTQQNPILEKTPFMHQYSDNFNKTLGFSLNIPFFNSLMTYTSIQNAKLNILNAKYNFDATNQTLYKTIFQAYTNVKSALQKHQATIKAFDASKISYDANDVKYKSGAVSFFDYSTAKNRLTSAEINMLQAKYDLFFKIKILEFYAGKSFNF